MHFLAVVIDMPYHAGRYQTLLTKDPESRVNDEVVAAGFLRGGVDLADTAVGRDNLITGRSWVRRQVPGQGLSIRPHIRIGHLHLLAFNPRVSKPTRRACT